MSIECDNCGGVGYTICGICDAAKENIEIDKLRTAIGLLNSMVVCGEQHSDYSIKVVAEAVDILKSRRFK